VNTTPLYVGLYTLWVLRIPLARGFVLGGALALGGSALLLGLDSQRSGAIEGDVLALAAAGFYSIYLLAMKRARESLSTLAALMFAGLAASVVLGIYGLALGEPFFGFPVHSWLAILAAAIVSQIGGLFGIAWALRYLPATFASVGLLAQPVGTAILGWIILGEALQTLQLVGAVAVLVGIGVAARDPATGGPLPVDARPD
jgi:drug/metabolite transporter (DMT)-like permease